MARYTVTQDYRSGLGAYDAGQEVDVPDELAAHINRDAPGTLKPADEEEPVGRQADAPPSDRMVKSARRRDRVGDSGDQGAMDKADHPGLLRDS